MKHRVELVFNVQNQKVLSSYQQKKEKSKSYGIYSRYYIKEKNMSTMYTYFLIVIQTRRKAYINHTFQRPSLR